MTIRRLTIPAAPLLLVLACACGERDCGIPPGEDTAPGGVDTQAPADTSAPQAVGCGDAPASVCQKFTGRAGGFAGRWVDAGDLDSDGLHAILVSESADASPYIADASVHLLSAPAESAALVDAAWARIDSPDDAPFSYWGAPSVILTAAGQVALRDSSEAEYFVKVFTIPPGGGVIPADARTGRIQVPAPYQQFDFANMLTECQTTAGNPALCVTTVHTDTELVGNVAGQVLVYEAPILGDVHVMDAVAQYQGDPGDDARRVSGTADLDGDGRFDLLIGAYSVEGVGKLAVLHSPPDGVHRVWDVADATVHGTVQGGKLGIGIASGDLDGDGHADILAGAPIGAPGAAYVLRGPHAGERSAADAEWSVVEPDGDWLGYDLAVGDFDGDGAADLAVGAPRSIYAGDEPGTVLVFLAPPEGTYTADDASAVLVSGSNAPDGFGISLAVGDIDGDGRDDVAAGAPTDPTAGELAGSVTLLFGGGF